jgi:pyruvate/2-oxoglutarate dehydrogenase complex dihydrolipoamide dehydrogenase (E3) component
MYFSGFPAALACTAWTSREARDHGRRFHAARAHVIETEWELIAENIQRHHITTIQGTARFVDARTLEVTRYGTRPAATPPTLPRRDRRAPRAAVGFAIDDEVVVDSDTLLTASAFPASMIVIGEASSAASTPAPSPRSEPASR